MWIDRDLFCEDRDGEWKVIGQARIDTFSDPLVILGDPGVGKTALMRHLGEGQNTTYVHAAALVRAEDPETLLPEAGRVAVDGLDEIATPGTGSAVEAVLRQLRRTECWSFIMSCRTAEWRDAVDRARIEDARAGEIGDVLPDTLRRRRGPGLPGARVSRESRFLLCCSI